jgi:hypothetical protein
MPSRSPFAFPVLRRAALYFGKNADATLAEDRMSALTDRLDELQNRVSELRDFL